MKHNVITIILILLALDSFAQSRWAGAEVFAEASVTVAHGDYAPLWLSANRYGVASVRKLSNYERFGLIRPIEADSGRTWRLGYAADIAIGFGHERTFMLQQAYAEVAWKVLRLTVGAKEQPMETCELPELSSGAMMLGINARPIPQARLDIDWFNIPFTKGWWRWKLHGSFGLTTDGKWQESWHAPATRYARHTLYHQKALFWQFGRKDIFPLTYEIGIQMATQFGGTSYNVRTTRLNDNQPIDIKHNTNLRAFWQALTCQGDDATDGTNPNSAGNTLGSYLMQLKYHGKKWQARAYWERFFEDHSMLTVQYGIRDMLIGGDVSLPKNPFLSAAKLEFLCTRNQSGAVYHDGTHNIPDAMAGQDNYYNHLLYAGWQHYGQTIGHPFLTSPIYNADHNITFRNNRIRAWHVGLSGDPSEEWHWRALLSFTKNWGKYEKPFDDPMCQQYFLLEGIYRPRWAKGWQGTLGLGLDHGPLLGNSQGFQLSIRKTFDY